MGLEVVYRADSTDERPVGQMVEVTVHCSGDLTIGQSVVWICSRLSGTGCCSAWQGVLMAVTVTAMLAAAKVNKLAD